MCSNVARHLNEYFTADIFCAVENKIRCNETTAEMAKREIYSTIS